MTTAAEPGAMVYLAVSGEWHFPLHDPSGLTDDDASPLFHTVMVGPFSSVAKAEAALDARLAQIRSDMWRMDGQFATSLYRPFGGTEQHGTAASWSRDVSWLNLSTGEWKQGWQEISMEFVDGTPD